MSRGGKKKKAKIAEILRKLTEGENKYSEKLEDYSPSNVMEEEKIDSNLIKDEEKAEIKETDKDFEINSKEIGKLLDERASTEEESTEEEKDWVVDMPYDLTTPSIEPAGSSNLVWNLFHWTS